ncbi:MAG: CRISPR-associated endonuclease Cas2 [Candidatus Competibacteraceae bacterium]|nr:CRISPR-associated endonuclease Cas2 [Candidatus Competibacteraceae bacterium]
MATWVVAYDIGDDKRRSRLYRLLRGFGEPVQKSVFVCQLNGRRKAKLEQLLGAETFEAGERLDLFLIGSAEAWGPGTTPVALEQVRFVIAE